MLLLGLSKIVGNWVWKVKARNVWINMWVDPYISGFNFHLWVDLMRIWTLFSGISSRYHQISTILCCTLGHNNWLSRCAWVGSFYNFNPVVNTGTQSQSSYTHNMFQYLDSIWLTVSKTHSFTWLLRISNTFSFVFATNTHLSNMINKYTWWFWFEKSSLKTSTWKYEI